MPHSLLLNGGHHNNQFVHLLIQIPILFYFNAVLRCASDAPPFHVGCSFPNFPHILLYILQLYQYVIQNFISLVLLFGGMPLFHGILPLLISPCFFNFLREDVFLVY